MTQEIFIIEGTDYAYCAKHPLKKYEYKKYDGCFRCFEHKQRRIGGEKDDK